MNPWWQTLASSLLVAVVSGVFGLRVSRRAVRRDARMDAVKSDLEVAKLLGVDDEERRWLTEFARLRIRAVVLEETRGTRTATERGEIAYFLLGAAVPFGYIVIASIKFSEIDSFSRIVLLPLSIGFIPYALWLARRTAKAPKTRYVGLKLASVDHPATTDLSTALDALNTHIATTPFQSAVYPGNNGPEGDA